MKGKIFGVILVLVNVFIIGTIIYVYQNVSSFTKEIVITDADFDQPAKKKNSKEVVITDKDFQDYKEVLATSGESKEEKVKVLDDNSKVYAMSDGHGNQTLIRSFPNHSRVKKIVLRMTGNTPRQIFVYAQNGKVKMLSVDKVSNVLNSSADEIANTAKIYETREDRDRRLETERKRKLEEIRAKQREQIPDIERNVEFPVDEEPQMTETTEDNSDIETTNNDSEEDSD